VKEAEIMTNTQILNQGLASAAPGKALNVALWMLQALAAVAFVAAGSGKLLGTPEMVALFDAVGLGQWFRYLTGLLEVLGALLLIVPGTTAFGAVLLAGVMAGAAVVHLTVLHTALTAPLVLLALTAVIAWGRRSQLAGLLGSSRGSGD
jgi:putative oxidoreductase